MPYVCAVRSGLTLPIFWSRDESFYATIPANHFVIRNFLISQLSEVSKRFSQAAQLLTALLQHTTTIITRQASLYLAAADAADTHRIFFGRFFVGAFTVVF